MYDNLRVPEKSAISKVYRLLGELVRSRREALQITQEDLARRVGIARTSVSNIEKGRQRIPVHVLFALSDALGVEMANLLPSRGLVLPSPSIQVHGMKKMAPPATERFIASVLSRTESTHE
jgi:transcriptional regulator with XRE-family HTH domain